MKVSWANLTFNLAREYNNNLGPDYFIHSYEKTCVKTCDQKDREFNKKSVAKFYGAISTVILAIEYNLIDWIWVLH